MSDPVGVSETREWWVVRSGLPLRHGEARDLGPFTHRVARSTARVLVSAGWDVRLRRMVKGKVVTTLTPDFARSASVTGA